MSDRYFTIDRDEITVGPDTLTTNVRLEFSADLIDGEVTAIKLESVRYFVSGKSAPWYIADFVAAWLAEPANYGAMVREAVEAMEQQSEMV